MLAVMTGATLSGVTCDPSTTYFIEPQNQATGETSWYPVYFTANQAAGVESLGALAGRMTDVRYHTDVRHAAFLLVGDVATGSVPEGLFLPLVPSGQTESTVSVRAFEPLKWTSLRVYDRGECSFLVPWQSIAEQLSAAIVDQLEGDDQVSGVSLLWAELRPTLQSTTISGPSFPPLDIDRIALRLRFFADHVGPGNILGCDRVRMTLDFEVQLEPTAEAYWQTSSLDYYGACVRGVDTRDRNWPFSACCGGVGLPPPFDLCQLCQAGLEDAARALHSQVRQGTAPACASGGVLPEGQRIEDVFRVRSRDDLSGLDDRSTLLVGFRQLVGHPLGGRDVLARVTRIDNTENFEADRCIGGVRETVRSSVRNAFRRSLPLGVRDAVLGVLALDPVVVGGDVPCESSNECDFRGSAGPAFQNAGVWRGARHRCMDRDAARYESLSSTLAALVRLLPGGRFCHVQLEPKRLQARPDGMEIVFADDRATEPQGSLYQGLLAGAVCIPARGGVAPDAVETGPLLVSPMLPFRVNGPD
jgi:hypothetical protein